MVKHREPAPDPLDVFLTERAVRFVMLSEEDTRLLQRRWREVFAQNVKKATGSWTYQKFDWHAFSYDFVRSVTGEEAFAEYHKQAAGEFFIIPSWSEHARAYKCSGQILPVLTKLRDDLSVVPANFSWTMAFTHEDGWIGPFFSRVEWRDQAKPPPPPRTAGKSRKRRGSR